MKDQLKEAPWEEAFSSAIVSRIAEWKRRRGLSTAGLASRYSEIAGRRLNVTALNNILAGKRKSIGVAEVFLFARALDVSPMNLMLPVDSNTAEEVLPGWSLDAWTALCWVSGARADITVYFDPASLSEAAAPTDPTDFDGAMRFGESVKSQELLRLHVEFESLAEDAADDLRDLFAESLPAIARGSIREVAKEARRGSRVLPDIASALDDLRRVRQRMRARGMQLSEVRPDLVVADMDGAEKEELAASWARKVLEHG